MVETLTLISTHPNSSQLIPTHPNSTDLHGEHGVEGGLLGTRSLNLGEALVKLRVVADVVDVCGLVMDVKCCVEEGGIEGA